jgi:hypothetical protein
MVPLAYLILGEILQMPPSPEIVRHNPFVKSL